MSKLIELIAQYGVQCSETKELAPTREFAAEFTRCATLESEVAALRAEVENWKESAALFSRNADFYRGLIVKIGETFGAEAKTADDGTLQDDVLALKVPELVEGMREDAERYRWLRDTANYDDIMATLLSRSPHHKIDAAIDAARKESAK